MLGLLGIALPILPTTPFLLLTVVSYSKGSQKFYTMFTHSKIYKKYLKSFHEHQAMKRSQKIKLMIFVDTMMLISFMMVSYLALRIMLIVLVVIKYWYFHRYVDTIEEDKPKKRRKDNATSQRVYPRNQYSRY